MSVKRTHTIIIDKHTTLKYIVTDYDYKSLLMSTLYVAYTYIRAYIRICSIQQTLNLQTKNKCLSFMLKMMMMMIIIIITVL